MADIENLIVVPTGTVWVAGYIAKDSTPRGPDAPTLTLPARDLGLGQGLGRAQRRRDLVFSVLASALADGTLWLLDTTLTVPFIPEWMLQ